MEESYFQLWTRAANGKAERFAAGETIFSKGDSGDRMYIVRSGSVELDANGRLVETVEPNGIFGDGPG